MTNDAVLLSTNTSGYKWVSWNKPANKWQVKIMISGKRQSLGRFPTPEAAAEAYDKAALQHFGEFACTNAELSNLNHVKNAVA